MHACMLPHHTQYNVDIHAAMVNQVADDDMKRTAGATGASLSPSLATFQVVAGRAINKQLQGLLNPFGLASPWVR